MEVPQAPIVSQVPHLKKKLTAVHDEDLDLGHVLRVSDAAHLGAHPFVDELLTPKPRLEGRMQQPKALPANQSQVAGGGSTGSDANTSGGLNDGAIDGRTSDAGPVTDTQGVVSRTGSAGSDSASANERQQ